MTTKRVGRSVLTGRVVILIDDEFDRFIRSDLTFYGAETESSVTDRRCDEFRLALKSEVKRLKEIGG